MEKTHPTISIVTRTKNRELLLKRCAQTVSSQTTDANLEWVVVNDGGQVEPVDIVVSQIYPQVSTKVIHNESSRGRASAANIGCEAASGDYVVLLDDDDTWKESFLERVLVAFEHLHDVSMVSTFSERVEEEYTQQSIIELKRSDAEFNTNQVSLMAMCAFNRLAINSVVFRKTVFQEVGGFDESLEVLEDYDFFLRCLSKYDIYTIPSVLSRYHVRVNESEASSYTNSTTGLSELHQFQMTRYRNKAMRKDLEAGKVGLGYYLGLGELYHEQLLARKELRLGFQSLFGLVNPVKLMRKLFSRD